MAGVKQVGQKVLENPAAELVLLFHFSTAFSSHLEPIVLRGVRPCLPSVFMGCSRSIRQLPITGVVC
jgi:hypothetical protein